MQNKTNTNIERIIAKIDNDFNPDNSDWIPRVAAWCIEAMQIIDSLPTEKKRMNLKVVDRIAQSPCINDDTKLKVIDECGREVPRVDEFSSCCTTNPSTGEEDKSDVTETAYTHRTVDHIINHAPERGPHMIAQTINTKEWPGRYNVVEVDYNTNSIRRNYMLIGNNKIELNYDTEQITIEYEGVKTCKSKMYGCEIPIIPNNGLLIEALTYYCIYKMLCRGYKHPVMNLAASQYGTNPYYLWQQTKEEAKRSIINDSDLNAASHLLRSNMFIHDYDPRHDN